MCIAPLYGLFTWDVSHKQTGKVTYGGTTYSNIYGFSRNCRLHNRVLRIGGTSIKEIYTEIYTVCCKNVLYTGIRTVYNVWSALIMCYE